MKIGDILDIGAGYGDEIYVGDILEVTAVDEADGEAAVKLIYREAKPEPVVLSEGSRFTDPNYFLRIPEGTVIDRDGIRCYLGAYNGYDALIAVVSIQDTNNVWYVSNERKDNVTYTVRLLPPGVDEVKIP